MQEDLKKNQVDRIKSISKAVSSLIPICGGAISELLENIIPNQRIDRIAKFLGNLNESVKDLDRKITELAKNPEEIDLLEDGFYYSSKALTSKRIKYISNIVSKGFNSDSLSCAREKKLLSILGNLSEDELCLLFEYSKPKDPSYEYDKNQDCLLKSYKNHLCNCQLITPNVKGGVLISSETFESGTGRMKTDNYKTTDLGNELLEFIGSS